MAEIRAFAQTHRGPLLLCAGAFTVFLSMMRPSVGEFGWVALAPFLVALHRDGSLRCHLGILATLLATFTLTVSKIVTDDIPWSFAPMFGLPMAVASFA